MYYIYLQYICKAHYFLDTTVFLAADLTSYAKTMSQWVFLFSHNILYWFYVNGEILKVIYDDIYNRITKFKAKNKIMKMSNNYSNVEKRIWTNVHEHHAHDKNNAGYVNVGSFPQ